MFSGEAKQTHKRVNAKDKATIGVILLMAEWQWSKTYSPFHVFSSREGSAFMFRGHGVLS